MEWKPRRCSRLMTWRIAASLLLILALAIYVVIPHRLKIIEVTSLLQNGMKMSAKITMRSPWGWLEPDRVCEMTASLNGKSVVVAPSAYRGVHPLDDNRKPMIAEKGGFPEIIMLGRPKSAIGNVHWYFQNYSFSEVDVVGQYQQKATYFGTSVPEAKEIQLAENNSGKPLIVIPADSIHRAPHKDNQ